MGIVELLLTAIALSMDAFAVSVCKGLGMRRMRYDQALVISLYFGVFQALMPLIGWLLGTSFSRYIQAFDHWIAFVLLVFLGGKMIIEAVRAEEEAEPSNPFALGTLFVMAIATSIDALATGIVFRSFSFSTGKLMLAVGKEELKKKLEAEKNGEKAESSEKSEKK